MKKVFTILSLLAISSTGLAANTCVKETLAVAKMNLDSKAKAYGFPESFIIESSLRMISQSNDGSIIYSVGGDIYKGEYDIQIGMDSSCSIESLRITDTSTR